jgi:hypothetical protein
MREVVVHEFIAALRQLQRPLVLLAAAILVLQSLVAGLAGGDTAARIATYGADVICHGNGDDSSAPAPAPAAKAAHDCCTFCSNPGPVTLSAGAASFLARLTSADHLGEADHPGDVRPTRRAIRAGPSQAPPTAA